MSKRTALPPTTSATVATATVESTLAAQRHALDSLAPTRDADVVKLHVKHADGPFGSVRPRQQGSPDLRRRLVAFDVVSVLVGWGLSATLPGLGSKNSNDARLLWVLGAAVVVQLLAIGAQHLYRGRVASRQAAEVSGMTRAALLAGLCAAALVEGLDVDFSRSRVASGVAFSLVLVLTCRRLFNQWLSTQRARGRYAREMLLVGTNDEAVALMTLLTTHPELGYRISGVTGDATDYSRVPWTVPYLGDASESLEALVDLNAHGVLIAASALDSGQLNGLTRELLRHEIHVHLSSGLQGIDHRRLRALPFAHEPLFYLEPSTLSKSQLLIKRAIDIVVAGFTLLLLSPVLIVAAIAIRLNDGGPVLFKQKRIGRNCQPFTVFKLRTMVPDAEARLSEVLETLGNGRDNVLFKLDNDPRRTRVGRLLEATSLDELPQLFNVLNGSMSLVGPRPALPSEVERFDEELLERFRVPPGITGLWQVEARDNPSFSAYRRLDLFYVENWSLSLDLVLMLETLASVVSRILRYRSRSSTTPG